MGKIPTELRETIAGNIRTLRVIKFPGKGGSKKCAESFGVSPQQWSPWERGMRTPDELRLTQIAGFFGTTVAWIRKDHNSTVTDENKTTDKPETTDKSPANTTQMTEEIDAVLTFTQAAQRLTNAGFKVFYTIEKK